MAIRYKVQYIYPKFEYEILELHPSVLSNANCIFFNSEFMFMERLIVLAFFKTAYLVFVAFLFGQ